MIINRKRSKSRRKLRKSRSRKLRTSIRKFRFGTSTFDPKTNINEYGNILNGDLYPDTYLNMKNIIRNDNNFIPLLQLYLLMKSNKCFSFVKYLGSGNSGNVYEIKVKENNQDKHFAYKISNKPLYNEFTELKKYEGIAPTAYNNGNIQYRNIFIYYWISMEPFTGNCAKFIERLIEYNITYDRKKTLVKLFVDKTNDIIDILCSKDDIFFDIKPGNFVYRLNNNEDTLVIKMIDFDPIYTIKNEDHNIAIIINNLLKAQMCIICTIYYFNNNIPLANEYTSHYIEVFQYIKSNKNEIINLLKLNNYFNPFSNKVNILTSMCHYLKITSMKPDDLYEFIDNFLPIKQRTSTFGRELDTLKMESSIKSSKSSKPNYNLPKKIGEMPDKPNNNATSGGNWFGLDNITWYFNDEDDKDFMNLDNKNKQDRRGASKDTAKPYDIIIMETETHK